MKRFRDYSKWPTMRLLIQAQHHRDTVKRLSQSGFPHGFNTLVLAEIERVLLTRTKGV